LLASLNWLILLFWPPPSPPHPCPRFGCHPLPTCRWNLYRHLKVSGDTGGRAIKNAEKLLYGHNGELAGSERRDGLLTCNLDAHLPLLHLPFLSRPIPPLLVPYFSL
jgi:hypothetical protein